VSCGGTGGHRFRTLLGRERERAVNTGLAGAGARCGGGLYLRALRERAPLRFCACLASKSEDERRNAPVRAPSSWARRGGGLGYVVCDEQGARLEEPLAAEHLPHDSRDTAGRLYAVDRGFLEGPTPESFVALIARRLLTPSRERPSGRARDGNIGVAGPHRRVRPDENALSSVGRALRASD